MRRLLIRIPPWLSGLVVVTAVIVAGITLGAELTDEDTPEAPAIQDPVPKSDIPVPIATAVDGPDRDTRPDDPIILDTEAREIVRNAVETPEAFDLGGGLRGTDSTPVGQYDGPLATPSWPGCETHFLPTNWSNRTSRVRAIGLHYTAGANRVGKSDMNGLTTYASSPSAGVSWHFLIDAEGHCYYSVHVSKKAWTIGNLNSQTVNIEVIGTGREQSYPAASAGARKLHSVVKRIARIYNIPLRVGSTDGRCNVTRPGIITHWQGGPCSGGHHDIRPYDIYSVVSKLGTEAPEKVQTWCRKLNWYRDKERRGTTTSQERSNARERKRNIQRRGYTCTKQGAVKI